MTVEFGQWFRVKGVDMQWLVKSPVGRVAHCDRQWAHMVEADEPRLMVDTGEGPVRRRGRKKQNEYLCAGCAAYFYATAPPSMEVPGQEALFDES